MNNLLPNQERARNAIYALWINLGITSLLIAVQIWRAQKLLDFDGEEESQAIIELGDQMGVVIAVLYAISFILCAVTFILWFRRAYANLRRTNTAILEYEEQWAAIGWFVPFLNLFRPYTIAKEILYQAVALDPPRHSGTAPRARPQLRPATLVGWWWTCWVISNIAERLSNRIGDEDTAEGLATGFYALAYSSMLAIPAGLLCILFVQKVNFWEQIWYESNSERDIIEHFDAV
jgi:heme/copper-type cytochrome/quinol oxidase subunit 2